MTAPAGACRWKSALTREPTVVYAHALINAAGARAGEVANHVVHAGEQIRVRLTRRSHIVVRGALAGDVAYALPNADGRVVYVTPIGDGCTLIGAAAGPHSGDPGRTSVEREEVAYLLDVATQYFREPPLAAEVVWAFAAVSALPAERGLVRSGRAVVIDALPRVAPLISVYGGSLAAHRRLAEEVVDRLGRFRKLAPAWTATGILPGGGFPRASENDLVRALSTGYPFVDEAHARRLNRAYGTRAAAVLHGARSAADLGTRFGADLTEAEVRFLGKEEWAMSAEDILWRRSKLGLSVSAAEAEALAQWMSARAETSLPAA